MNIVTREEAKKSRFLRRSILRQRYNKRKIEFLCNRRSRPISKHSTPKVCLHSRTVVCADGTTTTTTSHTHGCTVANDGVSVTLCTVANDGVSVTLRDEQFNGCSHNNERDTSHLLETHYLGPMEHICDHCGAFAWYEERNQKSKRPRHPSFSICCQAGKVQLPLLKDPPHFLGQLLEYRGGRRTQEFRRNIRAYNMMFAFTSMGGEVDRKINKGRGPYSFRLKGHNYHRLGTLLPSEGYKPKFAQLYIHDTQNEVQNRLNSLRKDDREDNLDPKIVKGLIKVLDDNNHLARTFRMARDRFQQYHFLDVSLRIIGSRSRDARQYNCPTSSEVAAIMVGNGLEHNDGRDIIVDRKDAGLKRISVLYPSFMAMQYPLLFPYGEDGFMVKIPYRDTGGGRTTKRQRVSMREFYAYRIQQRYEEGQALIRGGRLFQQYVVDAYACIEEDRLFWYRDNQSKVRAELYSGLMDAVVAGDTTAASVGKRIVLPSTFTGGPRYKIQNYQDAIAICRWAGTPDLFITFTCNPNWREIREGLKRIDGQKAEDRPDVVARVFKMKLDALMKDLKQGQRFGRVLAAVYTVEFQKRGLPHVHILLFLHRDDKPTTITDVDKIISAELPDKIADPVGYEHVVQFMMHGPCGLLKSDAPCTVKGKCTKHFPKKFCSETSFDDAGFAAYKRKDDLRTATKSGIQLSNGFVVPYNRDLVVKFDAHINVEICNRGRSVKYLFKYINKGSDRATVVVEENLSNVEPAEQSTVQEVDEIKTYLDCRYVSAHEACWRIFNFPIQFREPAVERLSYHLEGEHMVIFRDRDHTVDVVNRPNVQKTMFTEWLYTNSLYEDARELTYVEFPLKWVWHKDEKIWTRRASGTKIGRLYYAHPTSGERFYLRLLLNVVRGPRCYEDIRTVNGVTYPDFKSACLALGLLEDDQEWRETLVEAGSWSTGSSLRELFVTLLLFCEVTNPLELWSGHWELLSDDIVHREQRESRDLTLQLSEAEIKNLALRDIERILSGHGKKLKDFCMPSPDSSSYQHPRNSLLREELCFDRDLLASDFSRLHSGLNTHQNIIFDVVIEAVHSKKGEVFFVYGSGGTGKTYLWKTIISRLHSEGEIVLVVASSGIASLLLPGGRTAHSRFKIPVIADDDSCCNIPVKSQLARLIQKTSLIIWDEAPLNHRNSFEAVDRTLRDLMRGINPNSENRLFGGITVAFGGDFRQVLPVVRGGTRETIVGASVNRSYIWEHCRVYTLTTNMRLRDTEIDSVGAESMQEFREWILRLGEGKLPAIRMFEDEDEPCWIKIPDRYLIPCSPDPIKQIVSTIYEDLKQQYKHIDYLQNRCILTTTNQIVDDINAHVISLIPGDSHTYLSADSISSDSMPTEDQDIWYPTEFLNTLEMSGMPTHVLQLKVGVPIMLLRNLNPSRGLCNGTRMIVTILGTRAFEAEILTGSHIGNREPIPRIVLSSSDSSWPFTLRRLQFPVKICFAMTINKSQGQTLRYVGVYLSKPVFSHGQLYVAVSRTSSADGLKILIDHADSEKLGYTKNIVYREIFNNLPTDSGSDADADQSQPSHL